MTIYDKAWLDAAYDDHLRTPGRKGSVAKDWGYSFFYCPRYRIETASIGLIGLNPAGNEDDPAWGSDKNRGWDCEEFAYLDQGWGPDGGYNPLQQQVEKLVQLLPVGKDEIFAAQLVPYCSSSWERLVNRATVVATFEPVWRELLTKSNVKLWISLGYLAGEKLKQILGATMLDEPESGWGKTRVKLSRNPNGVVVASLPHLSRYKLFSQKEPRLSKAVSAIQQALAHAGLPRA